MQIQHLYAAPPKYAAQQIGVQLPGDVTWAGHGHPLPARHQEVSLYGVLLLSGFSCLMTSPERDIVSCLSLSTGHQELKYETEHSVRVQLPGDVTWAYYQPAIRRSNLIQSARSVFSYLVTSLGRNMVTPSVSPPSGRSAICIECSVSVQLPGDVTWVEHSQYCNHPLPALHKE
jgi:hypothetical protein